MSNLIGDNDTRHDMGDGQERAERDGPVAH